MEDKCPNCGAPNNDYLDGFWLCGSIKSMPDDQNGHGTTCLIHQLAARDEEIAALTKQRDEAETAVSRYEDTINERDRENVALQAVLGKVKAEVEACVFDSHSEAVDRVCRIRTILSDTPAPQPGLLSSAETGSKSTSSTPEQQPAEPAAEVCGEKTLDRIKNL